MTSTLHVNRAAAAAILASAALSACASTAQRQGAPPTAARLRANIRQLERQANKLLDGGTSAFQSRLGGLRGVPVVVNQWASWCGPCRYEFPFFQRLARQYRGRVAFLGDDAQDVRGDATSFLRQYPVPYPHFYDQDASIARLFGGGRGWPTTAFYDRSGRVVNTHIGAYASEAKLDQDIQRYALRG